MPIEDHWKWKLGASPAASTSSVQTASLLSCFHRHWWRSMGPTCPGQWEASAGSWMIGHLFFQSLRWAHPLVLQSLMGKRGYSSAEPHPEKMPTIYSLGLFTWDKKDKGLKLRTVKMVVVGQITEPPWSSRKETLQSNDKRNHSSHQWKISFFRESSEEVVVSRK